MGCWGMGMSQSEEFCENYDNFMEEYDNGIAVAEITAGILAKYHAEFDDNDGVMHDVYFALAKAEWMCGEQSELVLNRVKEIVESGANIDYYRELEATKKDLIVRQRNLEKFLIMIQTSREKPRKRKRSAPPVEQTFPPLEIGDCFAYKYEAGYRVFILLERFKPERQKEQVMVAIFDKVYSSDALTVTEFEKEPIGTLFTVIASDFLGPSVIKKIAHVSRIPKKQARLLGVSNFMLGDKKAFREAILAPLNITLTELLNHCEENAATDYSILEVGGCYAYRYRNGYRFSVVLDRAVIDGSEYWLIAVLAGSSETLNVDFLNTEISSCILYHRDSLPNLRGWQKITSIPVPGNMFHRLYGNVHYVMRGVLDFLQDTSSAQRRRLVFRTLEPMLQCCRDNKPESFANLEIGGCYSYQYGCGSRFAIILDRFLLDDTEFVHVALLRNAYSEPPADYMNENISHFGIYSAETLPNLDDWTFVNRLVLPDGIRERISKRATTTESVLRFFEEPVDVAWNSSLKRLLRLE